MANTVTTTTGQPLTVTDRTDWGYYLTDQGGVEYIALPTHTIPGEYAAVPMARRSSRPSYRFTV